MSTLYDTGMVGGKWGRQGSGFLFLHDKKMLLLRRSADVLEPGTWSVPGGAIPERCDRRGVRTCLHPRHSAKREVREEMGFLPRHQVVGRCVQTDSRSGFTYTTYIARIEEKVTPRLNWESDDWRWVAEREARKMRLHPGFQWMLGQQCYREGKTHD